MRGLVVGLLVAGAVAGCAGDNPVGVAQLSVTQQSDLSQHEALWQQRSFHSYDFDMDRLRLGVINNLHVSVRGDSVAQIIDNETGLPPVNEVSVPTIDEVFADANSVITDEGVKVGLEFDEQYGYPTLFTVSALFNTPAGPSSLKISNLVPVQ
jgi:uncharacterized protein DUF6174